MPMDGMHRAVRRAALIGAGALSAVTGVALVHALADAESVARTPTASLVLIPVLVLSPGVTGLAARLDRSVQRRREVRAD